MSQRSWQIQIIQDNLEEAEETFEVLLTSPEGAVLGGISKAQVTIRGSGSRTGGRTGLRSGLAGQNLAGFKPSPHTDDDDCEIVSTAAGCRLNHGQHAPVLGGKEIPSDVYPQHGSIQLEKLPLGTDSVIWTRGDSISRPSGDATGKKVRVIGNPQVVSVCFERRVLDCVSIRALIIQISLMLESKSHFIWQVPPSSVFHNGTDIVFTVSRQHPKTS